jgi:hypothetical protein
MTKLPKIKKEQEKTISTRRESKSIEKLEPEIIIKDKKMVKTVAKPKLITKSKNVSDRKAATKAIKEENDNEHAPRRRNAIKVPDTNLLKFSKRKQPGSKTEQKDKKETITKSADRKPNAKPSSKKTVVIDRRSPRKSKK